MEFYIFDKSFNKKQMLAGINYVSYRHHIEPQETYVKCASDYIHETNLLQKFLSASNKTISHTMIKRVKIYVWIFHLKIT